MGVDNLSRPHPLVVLSYEIRLPNFPEVALVKKAKPASLLREARLKRNLSVAKVAQK
jgi:hypothetical protein